MVYVIPILILVAFSALFSSTETAFACVNKIRLKHMRIPGTNVPKRHWISPTAMNRR